MLTAIVRFSLRFRWVIVVLALIVIGYGVYSLTLARYDVFPEFAPLEVDIRAEAPGLSPEQVETLITHRIEEAIIGVVGIESLRSTSIQGLAVIIATFRQGSDIYRIREEIAQRLATLSGELPAGFPAPVMMPLTSSTSIVMAIGLTSEKRSLMDVTTIADWTVKLNLLAVPGVAKVAVYGSQEKEFQIQVDPEKMFKYALSLGDIVTVAKQSTGVRGAGFIDTGNQRIDLYTEGQSITPGQLAQAVVGYHNGANITLDAVADVVNAPKPAQGGAAVMGRPAVMLMVSSQYGANTEEVTRRIDKALESLRPTLDSEGIEVDPNIFRPATFIHAAVRHIEESLIIGAVLVILVLLLFLFNLRTAAISLTAIPLSLLAAATVLDRAGLSLNTMTLGGLAIAIGEVVDDAVIDVENILRRLRENRRSEHPRRAFGVVLDASVEVRGAVVYATFAVALVFLPILTMTGLAGRLFAPLGIAYITAIMASLVVALTVTPALSLILLGRGKVPEKEPPLQRLLKRAYHFLLRQVERIPWPLIVAAMVVLAAAGLAAILSMGGAFLPELAEGHYIVHMTAVPGTSIEQSLELGHRVTNELLKIPNVISVGQRVGRTEEGDDVMGTNGSELEISLKEGLSGDQIRSTREAITKTLSKFTGVVFEIDTFLTERINETLSGFLAPVVVNIFSHDLDTLDRLGQDVARVLQTVPGAAAVQVKSPPGAPLLNIKLRRDEIRRWGLEPMEALDAIRVAHHGETASQVYIGDRIFDVTVILPPHLRNNMGAVVSLPLRNPSGTYIQLGQLADIYQSTGRYSVLHEGARRVQAVTCKVVGRGVSSFVAEAEKRIHSQISFPPGTYVEFTGSAQEAARSARQLLVHSLIAGLGIILLLAIEIGSFRNLLLMLINLPFALVGGALIAYFAGLSLSVGAMVGFVTLFGITLRNSIMLISHFDHLVKYEGMTWGVDASLRGATERLVPILMTATVTALGLLPLAIQSGAPGLEIEGPMAIVILGGLVSSTLLNLLILPTLARRFGRFRRREPEV